MVITNKDRYNTKYGFPKGTSHSKRDISKTNGIPYLYHLFTIARHKTVRRLSDGKKTGTNTLKG